MWGFMKKLSEIITLIKERRKALGLEQREMQL